MVPPLETFQIAIRRQFPVRQIVAHQLGRLHVKQRQAVRIQDVRRGFAAQHHAHQLVAQGAARIGVPIAVGRSFNRMLDGDQTARRISQWFCLARLVLLL